MTRRVRGSTTTFPISKGCPAPQPMKAGGDGGDSGHREGLFLLMGVWGKWLAFKGLR
jgi:hypothetical protein